MKSNGGIKKSIFATYMRNFVFGVEDSLVSTVGMLSGIAVAQTPGPTIILAGIVLIFVEAFSMGVGSFLSEDTAQEYMKGENASTKISKTAALIMFVAYFIAGFIPLSPYLFLDPASALPISIVFSSIALFILGGVGSVVSKIPFWKGALKMLIIGGIAITLGVVVGTIVHTVS